MSLLFTFVGAPPTVVETILSKEFPMLYRIEPITSKELRSRVSGATINRIAKDFPEILIKTGMVKELKSRWS